MKIVCTTSELLAVTRECQAIRSNVFEDCGCTGCVLCYLGRVLCHLCDSGDLPGIPFASSSFEDVCDIEVVIDG